MNELSIVIKSRIIFIYTKTHMFFFIVKIFYYTFLYNINPFNANKKEKSSKLDI